MSQDPEAALAAQAAKAAQDREYADLPVWVRPGRSVGVLSYGSAGERLTVGTVEKILARYIVVGDGMRFQRSDLHHRTSSYGGSQLVDLAEERYVAMFADQMIRLAGRRIEKIAGGGAVEDVQAAAERLTAMRAELDLAAQRIDRRARWAAAERQTRPGASAPPPPPEGASA